MAKFSAALSPEKYLSRQEEGQLLVNLAKFRASNLRDTTIIMLMLKTGARPREALNLTWGDINDVDHSVFIRTVKRGIPRSVPLVKDLRSRLAQMKRGSNHERIFKFTYWRFIQVWNELRPVRKPPYCLRHTFALNIYKNSKYNLWLTQQALGHSNIQTTSVYLQLHANVDDFRKAIGE